MLVILTLITAIGFVGLAGWGWRQQEQALVRVRSGWNEPVDGRPKRALSAVELDGLPAPVQRYLRWAFPEGFQPMELVCLQQQGRVRTDPNSEKWLQFTATHWAVVRRAEFVWDAAVRLAGPLFVRVIDALSRGQGSGRVSLLSVLPLGQESNRPEMNAGALHRYLAEAVWYPAALWPSERLQWAPIDENRAKATLNDGSSCVTLEFRFAADGAVQGIYTTARWGKFREGFRQAAWEGHFSDYRIHQGVRIPVQGEVGWYIDDRYCLVWQGRLTQVRYNTLSAV